MKIDKETKVTIILSVFVITTVVMIDYKLFAENIIMALLIMSILCLIFLLVFLSVVTVELTIEEGSKIYKRIRRNLK